jgi:hypothetical protein
MEKNYVKKELLKSREMASFSHYTAGNLYYHVKVGMEVYQFPIPTVEDETFFEGTMRELKSLKLSSDLGTTTFGREMRGSHLNRWIDKAIDNGEFVLIEPAVAPI